MLLEVYDPEKKVSAPDVLVEPDFGNEDSVVPSGAIFVKVMESRVSSDLILLCTYRSPCTREKSERPGWLLMSEKVTSPQRSDLKGMDRQGNVSMLHYA